MGTLKYISPFYYVFLNYCIIKRFKIENCFGKLFLGIVSINTIHGQSSQEGEWTKREEKQEVRKVKLVR